jgi:hypothetical protein
MFRHRSRSNGSEVRRSPRDHLTLRAVKGAVPAVTP